MKRNKNESRCVAWCAVDMKIMLEWLGVKGDDLAPTTAERPALGPSGR
jgi:hypothetical protein